MDVPRGKERVLPKEQINFIITTEIDNLYWRNLYVA